MAGTKNDKKLFIVESPAKAKTIKKILGRDYTVMASVGHIRDLKSKGRGKKTFGIDVENNYNPLYEIIPGKEQTIKELSEAAAKCSMVYLAPDPDREGEAIAWHLKEALELTDEQVKRVTYQAVTRKAIMNAVDNPREIDMDLVSAQQGRRILDRLVGFSLSPFLWKKVAKNLSAGRVQSVAVKIVVDREREIEAFIPEEFWRIKARLLAEKEESTEFEASLVQWKNEKFELGNAFASTKESAEEISAVLKKSDFRITNIEKKNAKGKPSAPFITSTLQQASSTKLHFNTSKTMRLAQKLYEGKELEDGTPVGLITYMRTDSTRIAPEALEEVREYISSSYDSKYLPEKPNLYGKNKNSQDAHEAIRPTNVTLTPQKIKSFLTKDEFRLYELIWLRFVASQMNPAEYQVTTLKITAADGLLEAKGRITLFDGYTVLIPENKKEGKEESRYQDLPKLEKEDSVLLNKLLTTQHFTKPPARYSEASLVRALEKEGIGRPSTYAPIVKTIQDRGYVKIISRYFHATELGCAVNDILEQNFSQIMDLKFTAGMEKDLDNVEQGEKNWITVVDDFYKPFSERVKQAIETAEPLKNKPYTGDEKCPLCSSDLVIRYSTNGAFLGCSKYPECKGLLPFPEEKDDDDPDKEAKQFPCPVCSRPMVLKTSRYGKKFFACSGYPECKHTMSVDKEGNPVELPKIERKCNKCGADMEVKSGRRGAFLACSNYPECKNTLPIDKEGKVVELPRIEGEVCEKCGSEMVVKSGRRGPFLACSAFPKCKNAKPIPKESVTKE